MDFVEDIQNGALFIYPTDTIYGIGCDATNTESVMLLKEIKYKEKDKPISIIAPSIEWIKKHCEVEDSQLKKYLPGPYTLLLKKKDPEFLKHISNNDCLGIRIPDSEFTKLVTNAGVPFITTSVNYTGEPFAVHLTDIEHDIINKVDIVIGVGKLDGRPSTIITVEGKEIKR